MQETQNLLVTTGRFCHRARRRMAIMLFISFFVVFNTSLFLSLSPVANAAQTVPYKMNFQGRITDSSGNVLVNGKYNMRLRLMSAASGGSVLWQADRIYNSSVSTDYRVQVTNGLFNVQFGDVASGVANDPALSPSLFNTQTNPTIYLEVELPTPATSNCASTGCQVWSEGAMTPRQLISAAPYAMNADTIDGIDGASLAQLSGNNTFTGSNVYKPSSDSTTAFQIQKSDSTPLLVADTQNLALKIGGGNVSPNGTPALLVLDHKNTSGDPTGINGAMYYNTVSGKFRCYEDSIWKDCIGSGVDLRTTFLYQNDFTMGTYTHNATADGSFTLYSYVSNLTVTAQASEASHPGIARMTPTASGGVGGFTTPSATTVRFGGSGTWTSLSSVRVNTPADANSVYGLRVGFINGLAPATEANISNGCYMRHSVANSGRYEGVCRAANIETVCDTTVSPTTSWDVLSITVNSTATAATFSVNGSSPCSVGNNIPTAVATTFGVSVYRTGGTQNRAVDVDYFEIRGVMPR